MQLQGSLDKTDRAEGEGEISTGADQPELGQLLISARKTRPLGPTNTPVRRQLSRAAWHFGAASLPLNERHADAREEQVR
jgi:hypothetical protein